MWHTSVLIFLSLQITLLSFSQPRVDEEFVIHFEDGIGNRDSITLLLNWHDNCNPNGMWPPPTFPELGEQIIVEPFDSVFEVRAVKGNALIPFHAKDGQYKTLVICHFKWQNYGFDVFEDIFFIPRIKHLPLKIYWDFNWLKVKKQLNATWLTNDHTWFIYDGGIENVVCCLDDSNYYDLSICASEYGDTIILDSLFLPLDTFGNVLPEAVYISGNELIGDNQMPSPNVLEDSLKHEGGSFLPILFLTRLQPYNPFLTMCNTKVGIAETELPYEIIFTQQQIIFDEAFLPVIKKISVIDMSGKEILQSKYYGKPLNIAHLLKGLYVLLISDESGNQFSKKFIKL